MAAGIRRHRSRGAASQNETHENEEEQQADSPCKFFVTRKDQCDERCNDGNRYKSLRERLGPLVGHSVSFTAA